MQRGGSGHAHVIRSLTNSHLALHIWATAETCRNLRRYTTKASQSRLPSGPSGKFTHRSMHTKSYDPETDPRDSSPHFNKPDLRDGQDSEKRGDDHKGKQRDIGDYNSQAAGYPEQERGADERHEPQRHKASHISIPEQRQGDKRSSPLTFQAGPLERRIPWADTRPDIKRGNFNPKYVQTGWASPPEPDRDKWDYIVQLKEYPDYAKMLEFWINVGWLLRYKAKDLGYYVAPDGFVRISDMLRFRPFSQLNGKLFATLVCKDPKQRFEVARLPDFVNGKLQDVYWVRAKAKHNMPGVLALNKRIIQAESINTAIYLSSLENWEYIQAKGIPPGEHGLINLERDLESYIFEDGVPKQKKYLCVTLDCVAAAKAGTAFYHTNLARLFAIVPSESGHIPPSTLRSAVLLNVSTKQALPTADTAQPKKSTSGAPR